MTAYELCPHCNTEAKLRNAKKFKPQRCPHCGKWILPCSLCEEHDYRHCGLCNKGEKND